MDNLFYLEALYAEWQKNPASVDPRWNAYFNESVAVPQGAMPLTDPRRRPNETGTPEYPVEQCCIDRLLWAYRDIGYLYSRLNPLGDYSISHSYLPHKEQGEYEKLTLEEFGIPESALDQVFFAGRFMVPPRARLREILEAFNKTYCSSIGVEFLHIQNKNIRRWLIREMESTHNHPAVTVDQKRTILIDLLRTETLEHFLDTYFLGQKRFSLEGSEALIPALHFLVDSAAQKGIEDVVIGTTHRGRLSILTTILNMPAEELFERFDENFHSGMYGGSGDVKYHMGYDTVHVNEDGSSVNVTLASNPSHLESVGPVIEGMARAREDKKGDQGRERVVPIILHGDAAVSGQGVVAETFNLSRLEGYATGGTIHLVINNQIGFTTPSRSGRSTFFPTDIAKMLPIPIFHVNGDDPESIVYIVNLALRFRQEFHQDCVIDIFCYRRHGHNEGDEPAYTHPHMYKLIRQHPPLTTLYGAKCDREAVMSSGEQEALRKVYQAELKVSLDKVRAAVKEGGAVHAGDGGPASVKTGVAEASLRTIAASVTAIPPGFAVHPKLLHSIAGKRKMVDEKNQVDWSFAEALAFGTLLMEGIPVRLSGQDSERGTFSQRHLTWWDAESPSPRSHTPLNVLGPGQALLSVYNSPLSEYSVLGFEYGYSLVNAAALTLWESQFGDFANGAQVVIDNYLACAESKWQQKSGLVLLLPHGNEGQGPDHSSAHLERFLQQCAQENMQVANVTTPAQYFHLLRRQVLNRIRKPLVIMSPKSLLRHPLAVSNLTDLAEGEFMPVLNDHIAAEKVTTVLLCSGKIYYDLLAERDKNGRTDRAIIRLEQLYPFPEEMLAGVFRQFRAAPEVVWIQEEHKNYGAWRYVSARIASDFPEITIRYRGRPEAASAATGKLKDHRAEQQKIVKSAFTGEL